MRRFAEDEIVIPDGPFKGRKFRSDRQPYAGLWFDQISSGRWSRMVATGPVQSGKTLTAFVIPTMYHLFEIGETVIVGLPSMDMAADKWEKDFLPAIEASRFREFIPPTGAGSRGGKFTSMTFANGATLRFMSGGGGDKKRAGYTARVVVITETDGMDEAGEVSREADKITQLEARTESYGDQARIYMECTVSIEKGRTWQEYTHGTKSRIVVRCRACDAWVTPEREHLVGWQDVETKIGAKAAARFCCPACGVVWSDEDRRVANEGALLVHRGQEVTPDGQIVGAAPETDTLGFRWSAFNNLFQRAGDFGAKEWSAAKAADPDNAEKGLRQFTWCLPVEPEVKDSVPLDQDAICRRIVPGVGKGMLPPRCERITVGVDLGKFVGHYVVLAWIPGGSSVVIDYGAFDIPSHNMVEEKAIPAALREFRTTICEVGWQGQKPHAVGVDSNYQTAVVYAACRESSGLFIPTRGHGIKQYGTTPYVRPKKRGGEIRFIGDEYHVARRHADKVDLLHINADHWKTRVHERFSCPENEAGALRLFDSAPSGHLTYARHVTAEKRVEEWEPGVGTVVRWEKIRKQNHFLDATELAVVVGDYHGGNVLPTVRDLQPAVIGDWWGDQEDVP